MNKFSMRVLAWICIILLIVSMVILCVANWPSADTLEEATQTKEASTEDIIDPSEWFVQVTQPEETHPPELSVSISTEPDPNNSSTWNYYLDDEDIYLLATAIYLEGGAESYQCQMYIGSIILNRMTTRSQTLSDVLYTPNQFSVVSQLAYSSPTDEQITVAKELAMYGPVLPECVTFFRANHYHDSNTVNTSIIKDWCDIDNTYFSHDIRICNNNH